MSICGDAQQRLSDASQLPLSSPHFARLPACAFPDHRDISEACPALSSVAASRYHQKAGGAVFAPHLSAVEHGSYQSTIALEHYHAWYGLGAAIITMRTGAARRQMSERRFRQLA